MFCIYCRTPFDENIETVCSNCGRQLYKKREESSLQPEHGAESAPEAVTLEAVAPEAEPSEDAMPGSESMEAVTSESEPSEVAMPEPEPVEVEALEPAPLDTGELQHICKKCGKQFPVTCYHCQGVVTGADAFVPPEGYMACEHCGQTFWVQCPYCYQTQEQSPEQPLQVEPPEPEPEPEPEPQQPGPAAQRPFQYAGSAMPETQREPRKPWPQTQPTAQQGSAWPPASPPIMETPGKTPQTPAERTKRPPIKPLIRWGLPPLVLVAIVIWVYTSGPTPRGNYPYNPARPDYSSVDWAPETGERSDDPNTQRFTLPGPQSGEEGMGVQNAPFYPSSSWNGRGTSIFRVADDTYAFWGDNLWRLDSETGERTIVADLDRPDTGARLETYAPAYYHDNYMYLLTRELDGEDWRHKRLTRVDVFTGEAVIGAEETDLHLNKILLHDGYYMYILAEDTDGGTELTLYKYDPAEFFSFERHDIPVLGGDCSYDSWNAMVWDGNLYVRAYDEGSFFYSVYDLATGQLSRFPADGSRAYSLCADASALYYTSGVAADNTQDGGAFGVWVSRNGETSLLFSYDTVRDYYTLASREDQDVNSENFYYDGVNEIYIDGEWLLVDVRYREHGDLNSDFYRVKTDGSEVWKINFYEKEDGYGNMRKAVPNSRVVMAGNWMVEAQERWLIKDNALVYESTLRHNGFYDAPVPFDRVK